MHLDGCFKSRNVDIAVEDAVEVADNVGVRVRQHWILQVGVLLLRHLQQILPFFIHFRFLLLVVFGVLDGKVEFVLVFLLQSSVECLAVNFFEDGFKGV